MKKRTVVVFFSIFFTLYGLVNFYIFLRGWQALPKGTIFHTVYTVLFVLLAGAFIEGRRFEKSRPTQFSAVLIWVGSFWLGAMLYFFLAVVIIDLMRVLNHFFGIFPSVVSGHYESAKEIIGGGVVLIVLAILGYGYRNAVHPRIRQLHFAVAKAEPNGIQELRIAVVSDIHLGTIVGRKRLEEVVGLVASIRPDIILLPGDIVDEDLGPVIRNDLGKSLRRLQSPLGVYAVTGNHEYIGGVEQACAYLVEHGITMLRDECVTVGDVLILIGREDRSIKQFAGKERKSLSALMLNVDTALPVILMDHQPFHLEEAAGHSIDLQLSGHTHHGQLWPLNYITKMVYEVSWGYFQKGKTHIYVSCGAGTWGPPVRTGNKPEILDIRLTFDESAKM